MHNGGVTRTMCPCVGLHNTPLLRNWMQNSVAVKDVVSLSTIAFIRPMPRTSWILSVGSLDNSRRKISPNWTEFSQSFSSMITLTAAVATFAANGLPP